MIKIVSSMYCPDIGGGAELSTQILSEGIQKSKKFKVEVLTNGLKTKEEIINQVKVKRKKIDKRSQQILSNAKNRNLKGIKKIDQLKLRLKDYFSSPLYEFYLKSFQNEKIKVVHTTNNMLCFDLFSCWKAAKKQNKKVIHTLRDPSLLCFRLDLENKKTPIIDNIHRIFTKRSIKNVDIVHSPSQFMIDLHKKYGFKFKNEVVIPNTVNIEIKEVDFNLKEDTIVYVGGIEEYKGVLTLVEAFSKLKNNKFKLVLIGSGSLESAILEKYKYLNIEITGWIDKEEVYKKIQKSKILILPSEWDEAFGRVLVEGVYNSTLVIGSNRGAIPEVLNYKKKYIFEEKNIDELKQKIERIIQLNRNDYSDELYEMKKFMEKYNIDNHIKKFIELYKKII